MNRKSHFAIIAAFLLIVGTSILIAAGGDPESGKEVYTKQKCKLCHSISGVGNKKMPLDGVGSKLSEADIAKWIKTPKEMKADTIMKAYSELSDEELGNLAAYMMTLK